MSESSTFWVGLGATALNFLATKNGWPIDPVLLIASVLGYAGKEAASKLSKAKPTEHETAP